MPDILARLYKRIGELGGPRQAPLFRDAAKEIERLRAQVEEADELSGRATILRVAATETVSAAEQHPSWDRVLMRTKMLRRLDEAADDTIYALRAYRAAKEEATPDTERGGEE